MDRMISSDYIDTKLLVDITGWSYAHVVKMIQRNKFQTVRYQESGRGGKAGQRPLIHISDPQIPPAARLKYAEINPDFLLKPVETDSRAADLNAFNNAPDYARRQATKYMKIINASVGLKGNDLKAFIDSWNEKNPDEKTSYPRVMDARKVYKELGAAGLLARYGNRAGETVVTEQWYQFFKSIYMKEGAPSASVAWHMTKGFALQADPEMPETEFPSAVTFVREVERREPQAAIELARYGEGHHNRRWNQFISRDDSNVAAGSFWVSDHHQVDIAVLDPKSGKPCFPWATVWRDYKTGLWLGWDLHCEAPNSDHIFLSFYSSAVSYGLPEHILIDNGKDYRCKDFAGGRRFYQRVSIDEKSNQMGAIAQLGITAHFSKPYNAQAKPIERDFLTLKNTLSKPMPGYRGGDVTERPEVLTDEIKAGLIMDFEVFNSLFNSWVNAVLNTIPNEGKNHKGLSRIQLWNQENPVLRRITPGALMLFCMRSSSEYTIGRNGIRESKLGSWYWGEWMSGVQGEKVYMRRDPKAWQTAWVFRSRDNDYLGEATLTAAASALATTDLEKQKLRDLLAQQGQVKKIHKAYASAQERPDPATLIGYMATGVQATAARNGANDLQEQKVFEIARTEMDEVIEKRREMAKTGTDDISQFIKGRSTKPQSPRVFFSPEEKADFEALERWKLENGE